MYVTDRYGQRNASTPELADIIIVGDSFAWGAGSSQEHTPAVQLSELTGRSVILAPNVFKEISFRTKIDKTSFDLLLPYERVAFYLKTQQPIKSNVVLWFIPDVSLWEELWDRNPRESIQEILNREWETISWHQRFLNGKTHIAKFSPQAIIARKLKTYFKNNAKRRIIDSGLYSEPKESYLEVNGIIYGIPKFPQNIEKYSTRHPKFIQFAEAIEMLYYEAKDRGITLLPVIIPYKNVAYSKYSNLRYKIQGYGPAELLFQRLGEIGIESVFTHPEIFRAVEEEVKEHKRAVYWGDDTHWGPYGINLAMLAVRQKLIELNLL